VIYGSVFCAFRAFGFIGLWGFITHGFAVHVIVIIVEKHKPFSFY
jgi:hypothetical protein